MILCKESPFFTKWQLYLSQATHNTRNPQEHCNLKPKILLITLRQKMPHIHLPALPCTLSRNYLSYRPQSQQSQLCPYMFFSFKKLLLIKLVLSKHFKRDKTNIYAILKSPVQDAGCRRHYQMLKMLCQFLQLFLDLFWITCHVLPYTESSILISCLIAQFSIHLLAESALCQATMCFFSIILLHW